MSDPDQRTYALTELAHAVELEGDTWGRDFYLRNLDIRPIPGTEPAAYAEADVRRLRDARMVDLRERFDRLIPRGFSFECGHGWRGILERFFETVESELPDGKGFVLRQVKEKFGGLRVYFRLPDGIPDEVSAKMREAADLASARAHHTCESCGQPGAMRNDSGWWFVACDEHAIRDGRLVPAIPDQGYLVRSGGGGWRQYDPESDGFVPSTGPTPQEGKG